LKEIHFLKKKKKNSPISFSLSLSKLLIKHRLEARRCVLQEKFEFMHALPTLAKNNVFGTNMMASWVN
jgi:hypothetical protein